jgi:hypothetical protein
MDIAQGEEGAQDIIPSVVRLPLKAIVRIRIPLKRPNMEISLQDIVQDIDDEGKNTLN